MDCHVCLLPVVIVVPLMQSISGNNVADICFVCSPSHPVPLIWHVGHVQGHGC
jgi:hypothetical protein